MSVWTKIRDWAGIAATGGASLAFSKSARNEVGKAIDAVTGRSTPDERRAQANAMQQQVNEAKRQRELQESEIRQKQAEKDVQQRRINEKQIRSLRNHYRPSGFLNNRARSGAGLGESADLPNKLGA